MLVLSPNQTHHFKQKVFSPLYKVGIPLKSQSYFVWGKTSYLKRGGIEGEYVFPGVKQVGEPKQRILFRTAEPKEY